MLVEVKVPQLSESVAEATLVSWHRKVGDLVKRDENLVDIETDKVVLETPAPDSGVLVKIMKGDGGTVVGKEIIATIDTEAKTATAAAPTAAPAPAATSAPAPASRGAAPAIMPAAQRIAADNKIDPAGLSGSGRGGRVTKGDVLDAIQGAPAAKAPAAPPHRPRPCVRRRLRSILVGSANGPSSACRCRACARASRSG